MTTGFNCKTTFWYFLYIFCCKNFPDDDEKENSAREKTRDFFTIAKTAIYRIFEQHRKSNHCPKKKANKVQTNLTDDEKANYKSCERNLDSMKSNVPNVNGTVTGPFDWRIGDPEDVDDDRLQYPVNESDDDLSSVSDVDSDKFAEDNVELCVETLQQQSSDEKYYESLNQESVAQENRDSLSILKDYLKDSANNLSPFNDLSNATEYLDINEIDENVANTENQTDSFYNVNETSDFSSTSFMTSQCGEISSTSVNKSKSYLLSKPDDFWDLFDQTLEEPVEFGDYELPAISDYDTDFIEKGSETMSADDKEIFKDKIKWLIPLKQDIIDLYIDSAIFHFFQTKEKCDKDTITDSLKTASESLPNIFTEPLSVPLSETEIGGALLNTSKQNPYIDKRIIFYLVYEIFTEIFSSKRCLPHMPWVHLSYMVKKKNYTLWKGSQPPESCDLVSKIVRERVYKLLNQTNISDDDLTGKGPKKCSHLNVIKWCEKRQMENVDKILTKELLEEENEWVFYDEAEEHIKIQMSEHIFNYLITDTISWLRSVPSEDGK